MIPKSGRRFSEKDHAPTVVEFISTQHRRLFSGKQPDGTLFEWYQAIEHERGRPHVEPVAVLRRIGRLSVGALLGHLQDLAPKGYHRAVRTAKQLPGAVDHRTHALLHRRILIGDADNAGIESLALCSAVDAVIVELVHPRHVVFVDGPPISIKAAVPREFLVAVLPVWIGAERP